MEGLFVVEVLVREFVEFIDGDGLVVLGAGTGPVESLRLLQSAGEHGTEPVLVGAFTFT